MDDEPMFDDGDDDDAGFIPVALRHRHDGWMPQKQYDFIAALGESGCVTEACAAVRMSVKSAYALRARPDASTFRQAWDVALDYAIRRLGDAAMSRALHGVSRPVFYQGEQIGERRHFDERLTMFLLRYRDPVRYGAWNDGMEARRHPDGAGIFFAHALNAVMDAAHGALSEHDAVVPLAEGPAPPRAERLPGEEEDDGEPFSPELEALAQAVRLAAESDNSPAAFDKRSTLTVRRPRRAKGGF